VTKSATRQAASAAASSDKTILVDTGRTIRLKHDLPIPSSSRRRADGRADHIADVVHPTWSRERANRWPAPQDRPPQTAIGSAAAQRAGDREQLQQRGLGQAQRDRVDHRSTVANCAWQGEIFVGHTLDMRIKLDGTGQR
jgi:hypothetical protein